MTRASLIASVMLLSLTVLPAINAQQPWIVTGLEELGKQGQVAKEHHDANLYNSASIDLSVTLTGQKGEESVVTVPAGKVIVIRNAKIATICSDKDHCSSTSIEYGKSYTIVADQKKSTWVIVEAAE